jgi:hypothetical protein
MKKPFLLLLLSFATALAVAHTPLPSNPFQQQGCAEGISEWDDSWAVFGALLRKQQVDFICFDATDPDLRIRAALVIPPKISYDSPDNDVTMVLVGPGLPDPGVPVPDGLSSGDGGIFASIHAEEGPFPSRNYLGWWYGPRIDETLPATGRYELRIYSPSDWHGEYILMTTGNDPNSPTNNLSDTKWPTPGDINQDGSVNLQDAIMGMVIALGIQTPDSSFALSSGDVAPPANIDLLLMPGDGQIDLADVTRILRRVQGLDQSEDWPYD